MSRNNMWLLIAIIGIVLFATGTISLDKLKGLSLTGAASAQTPSTSSLAFCPNDADGLANVQADIFAAENATTEYLVTTLSLYPVVNGQVDVNSRYTYASSPTSTRTAATAVPCGDYKVAAFVQRGNSTGLAGGLQDLKVDKGAVIFNGKIDESSGLTARAYDLEESAFIWGNDSLDGTNNAYETVKTTFQSTSNSTAKAIGAGQGFKWRVDLAAATGDSVYGGNSKTWMCLDYTPSDFEAPHTVTYNGVQLVDSFGSMSGDDRAQLSGFDNCYVIPNKINDIQGAHQIVIGAQAKGGVDPTTDWTVRFLAEDYILAQDGKTPISRIFRDSDGRQENQVDVESLTFDFS